MFRAFLSGVIVGGVLCAAAVAPQERQPVVEQPRRIVRRLGHIEQLEVQAAVAGNLPLCLFISGDDVRIGRCQRNQDSQDDL